MCRWLWEWLLFFEFVWNCDEKHITKVKKTAYVQTIYHCSILLNNIYFFWKYKCRKMFTNWITCFASRASVIWIATKLGTQKQYWVHDFHRVWIKSEYFFFKFQKIIWMRVYFELLSIYLQFKVLTCLPLLEKDEYLVSFKSVSLLESCSGLY